MGDPHAFVSGPRGLADAHLHRARESAAIWGVMAALMLPTIVARLASRAVHDADGRGNLLWILTLVGELV